MPWRSKLKSQTRQPEFLWRMVLSILAAGIGLGFVAQRVSRPDAAKSVATQQEQENRSDPAWDNLETLAQRRDWARLWWALPEVAYFHSFVTGPALLSAIAACCWSTTN